MLSVLKKNWFMFALIAIAMVVVADSGGALVTAGLWLKQHRGPAIIITLIFYLSGLVLDTRQIREGLSDIRGLLVALFLIFLLSPLLGFLFSLLLSDYGVIVGLFLVAVMPSTLSSGVVMTGCTGGNMAHSLFITVVANSLAVFTIPLTLSLLLGGVDSKSIEIEQLPMMLKITKMVLVPLLLGIVSRRLSGERLRPLLPFISSCNQLGILIIVFMALCAGRPAIVSGLDSVFFVIFLVFCFHLVLVFGGFAVTGLLRIPRQKRISVIFMGGQKTLALSVLLQVSLFPEFGIALVVCVMHHITHLIMDAYLVGFLKKRGT